MRHRLSHFSSSGKCANFVPSGPYSCSIRCVSGVEEYLTKSYQHLTTGLGNFKIWKKLISHNDLLRAELDRAKKVLSDGLSGRPILLVAQKVILRFQFLAYFLNACIKQM